MAKRKTSTQRPAPQPPSGPPPEGPAVATATPGEPEDDGQGTSLVPGEWDDEEQDAQPEAEESPLLPAPPPRGRRSARSSRQLAEDAALGDQALREKLQLEEQARVKLALEKARALGQPVPTGTYSAQGQVFAYPDGQLRGEGPPEEERREPQPGEQDWNPRQWRFWDFAAHPISAPYRLIVNRLEPLMAGDRELPTDRVLSVSLPKDRNLITRMVAARCGGGIYECRIFDESGDTLLHHTSGNELLDIEGDPIVPKKGEDASADLRRQVADEKLLAELAAARQRRREAEGKKDEGGGEFKELLVAMLSGQQQKDALRDMQAANERAQAQAEQRHRDEMAALKEMVKQGQPNQETSLIATVLQSNTALITAMMSKAQQPAEAPNSFQRRMEEFKSIIEVSQAVSGRGGGEDEGEGGGLGGMVRVLGSGFEFLNTMAKNKAAAAEAGTGAVSAAQAALPAPPPQGAAPMPQPQPPNQWQQVARQLVADARSGQFRPDAPWAKMLFRATSANPDALSKLLSLDNSELIAVIRENAPQEAGQIGMLSVMQPRLIPWLAECRNWLSHWNTKRMAAAQQAPASAPPSAPAPAEPPEDEGQGESATPGQE